MAPRGKAKNPETSASTATLIGRSTDTLDDSRRSLYYKLASSVVVVFAVALLIQTDSMITLRDLQFLFTKATAYLEPNLRGVVHDSSRDEVKVLVSTAAIIIVIFFVVALGVIIVYALLRRPTSGSTKHTPRADSPRTVPVTDIRRVDPNEGAVKWVHFMMAVLPDCREVAAVRNDDGYRLKVQSLVSHAISSSTKQPNKLMSKSSSSNEAIAFVKLALTQYAGLLTIHYLSAQSQ